MVIPLVVIQVAVNVLMDIYKTVLMMIVAQSLGLVMDLLIVKIKPMVVT